MSRASHTGAPLRMAVIGCGPIGVVHARAIAESPRGRLVAVCDPDGERCAAAAGKLRANGYASVSELLANEPLDAVTVATPDHLHVEPTLAAIAAGCHVFCEKPLATSIEDARRMVDAAVERRVHLAVDYNRRFGWGYRRAREWLDIGRIGQLRHCLVGVTDPTPPPKVARSPHVMLTTLLVHFFDLARWYAGEVRTVRAEASEIDAHGLMRRVAQELAGGSGASTTITADYRDNHGRTSERLELVGTSGSIVVEDIARRVSLAGATPGQNELFERNEQACSDAILDSVTDHVQAFIDQLASGREPPTCGRDGLAGLAIAAAAIESITTGRTIEVERL